MDIYYMVQLITFTFVHLHGMPKAVALWYNSI